MAPHRCRRSVLLVSSALEAARTRQNPQLNHNALLRLKALICKCLCRLEDSSSGVCFPPADSAETHLVAEQPQTLVLLLTAFWLKQETSHVLKQSFSDCISSSPSKCKFSDWSSQHGQFSETFSWVTFDEQADWQASRAELHLSEPSFGASCVERVTDSPTGSEVRVGCADYPKTRVLYTASDPPPYLDVVGDGGRRGTSKSTAERTVQ